MTVPYPVSMLVSVLDTYIRDFIRTCICMCIRSLYADDRKHLDLYAYKENLLCRTQNNNSRSFEALYVPYTRVLEPVSIATQFGKGCVCGMK